MSRRQVIDDLDHDGAGGAVAQGVGGFVGKTFAEGVRAVVRLRRGAWRRGQRVGVGAIGIEQDLPVAASGAADQGVGDCADRAADRTDQGATGGFTGVARLTPGDGAGRQILTILVQVEGFFVDGHVVVADRADAAVVHVDGDGGGAFVTVGIADGVGEHVARTGTVHGVRGAVVHGVAVGIQRQVTVGAVDLAVEAANGRGGGI